MKITSIALTNVRRFVDPVKIDGFGAGLNVLAAPNEHGKSTFFEALHAVFFVSHRSFDKSVKTLVPRVGGDPEVTVGFEVDGTRWQLTKCWSNAASRKDAQLLRDGRLVAQKEEAETMLSGLLRPPSDGGPAGLLWVRQGLVGLESGGTEQQARRDIMTSVAGEVEAMTGGRRMEAVLAKCAAFLGQHLTGTGKPKKNGGLEQSQTEVDRLMQERDRLALEVRRLQEDLDRRRQVRRELAELQAPETFEERNRMLAAATAVQEAAQQHDHKLRACQSEIARLTAQSEKTAAQAEALQDALAERAAAKDAESAARIAVKDSKANSDKAQSEFETLRGRHKAAGESAERAASDLRLALQAERAASAGARRKELTDRLEKSEKLRGRIEVLEAEIAREVSAATMKRLEALDAEHGLARRSRDNAAAAFNVTYDEGCAGKVSRDGVTVAGNTRHAVPDGALLDLAGIGRLEIFPSEAGADDSVAEAEAALVDALRAAGFERLQEARQSDAARMQADSRLRDAKADLKAAAPGGLAALREEIAALPEPVETNDATPDVTTAEKAEQTARESRDECAEQLEAARVRTQALREALTRAEAILQTTQERLQRAAAALAGQDDPQAFLTTLNTLGAGITAEISTAFAAFSTLQKDAPDLAAAQAAVTRARSVIGSTETAISTLREERAALDTRISVISSAAVEEELVLAEEQLADEQDRLERIRFEVAVYQRLERALNAAQGHARENYVASVHKELLPLLRMIWPDVEIEIDADTGLITSITRRGEEEDFGILSGGTQEQISLLVRLAFARILAADGRPAPVVLDDAIVYTDDDRIEQMFDALTRQSEDLQIIVFSCRQRAFRSLGGTALTISRVGG